MSIEILANKPPNKKQKQQRRKAKPKPLQSKKPKWLLTLLMWMRWSFFVGIPLVMTYETLYPDLSIEAADSLNSKMPLKTHFIIKNESHYSLHNIFYSCELRKIFVRGALKKYLPPEYPSTAMQVIAVPYPIESLSKGASQSLSCGSGEQQNVLVSKDEWLAVDKVFMDIRIFYSFGYMSHSFNKLFYFAMLRDEEGNVQWLPTTPD